ncbi:uridine kinase [Geodermatophilus sp. DSM 44513]|uniref:uridine kinase n=1 Tax=Geodermatophilus sp. DSM 44513 TaxID=1528104 RepID=UPI0028F6F830|nr:uridine kinase [Geodermatophilus sp. DSM 44513]WNV74693.1 uridine kinase [Geodermatophilus sp. DSM 44513]
MHPGPGEQPRTPYAVPHRAGAGRGPVLTRPQPLTPGALADRLAVLLAGVDPEPGAHALRVAVDGPDVARPEDLATAVAERLPPLGRPCVVVPAAGFLRAASLRLEHGRTDPDARYTDWLDAGALAREVLDPVGPGGSGSYLPVLWDVARDRAARVPPRPVPAGGVLLVPGPLLQGVGLAFDLVVHLRVAPPARRRRTPAAQAWELPAFDRYDAEVDPASLADAVVLADSPDHPALVLQGRLA